MKTPHKHHDLIVAWAAGAEIEVKMYCKNTSIHLWEIKTSPCWDLNNEYRIKPEPKPKVVLYACAYFEAGSGISYMSSRLTEEVTSDDNIKLTFDGETNELIKVELV